MQMFVSRLMPKFAIAGLLLCLSTAASATHLELSRISSQLSYMSAQLAHQLRYDRGYGSVQRQADRLSREAQELQDALARNRSDSRIRSKFHDVRRRYEQLEAAYLRASRSYRSHVAYNSIGQISTLFSNLSGAYYYTLDVERGRGYAYNPPVITQRYYQIPQTFQNNRQHNSNRYQSGRQYEQRQRNERYVAPRIGNYDHQSNVLQRQQRLNQGSRIDNRLIRVPRYQPRTETRRPNHYE